MKRWIERRTGVLFGTYRRPVVRDGSDQDVWLVIAPARDDRGFTVVLGRRGFYAWRNVT